MNRFSEEECLEIKRLFEVEKKRFFEIGNIMKCPADRISDILKGKTYDGKFKSEFDWKKPQNEPKRLNPITIQQILLDYSNFVPVPEILEKYQISRENLNYYRTRHNIENRRHRTPSLKSITIESNGTVKTYSSVEQAAKELNVASDYLHKLKRGQNFGNGKYSESNLIIVHSLERLKKLERASELVGKIFHQGSITEKKDYGNELKQLIYDLGYADELIVETETHNF